ncbi:calcineurin-like phosphoesterase [Vibrio parahaemolyticus]|uniref:metallophosphoesterase family protein n=1 Tax=Vibrio parahaemolyticus TaxID=670 RepID=UPI00248F6DB2|nr:metallophosphoesterase [Vibrio parahaemolyticus]EGQ8217819.1 calcineurin-like phosphoesterase [Vibrio parahaemolyticus]
MLRLLHFSDIHFRSPFCDSPDTDENIHIRDRVHRDILDLTKSDGKDVDAILITGDIAFAGKESEYRAAHIWLDELKRTLGLQNDRIFVVPGNHDVDRDAADGYLPRMVRNEIASKQTGWQRERAIQEALISEQAYDAMLAPMQKYVDFSNHYGCGISTNLTFWKKSLDLSDRVKVEFRGITTTLFSNKSDAKGSIVLSNNQLNFRSLPGVLNVSLMHHPCDWLINDDEVADTLDNNVHVQLFGHKHRSRWGNTDNVLKVESISLHPERHEPGYEPGYNIIDLSQTQLSEKKCTVTAKVVVRKLEFNPQVFVSKKFLGQKEFFSKEIILDIEESQVSFEPKEVLDSSSQEKTTENISVLKSLDETNTSESPELEDGDIKEASRIFGLLERSTRDRILIDCALLEQDELAESDVRKQQIAFQRAIEQGKENLLYDTIMIKGKAQ